MFVTVNGKQINTEKTTLFALRDSQYPEQKADMIVSIVNGYQSNTDVFLKEDDEITYIPKGVMPGKEELERMMCARHTPKVHEKVKQAHVAIAGLGGLGSNIAISLARTGVGHLHLIDFDIVEPSNLNRQQYKIKHLGMYKADALKQEIKEINPFIEVKTDIVKLTEQNVGNLLREEDLVCEAFDNPETKAMLVNKVLSEFPEKKIVAASGMAGYDSSNQIHTQKKMKNFYLCGDQQSEAHQGNGLMAPRVMICAGHQANMILRLIINETEA